MWQGLLALKNDIAAIQMHYVSGSETVARDSLVSQMPLRIAQRMRLEPSQLEGVGRRMTVSDRVHSKYHHANSMVQTCIHEQLDPFESTLFIHTYYFYHFGGDLQRLKAKPLAGTYNVPP